MDELDKIIRKIQDLMKLAQDNPDDEEGQTALLLAQKLLLKHNLSLEDIRSSTSQDDPEISEMGTKSLTRMPWWQVELHIVLAKNFRCKSIRRRRHQKTTLIFFGYEADVKMALRVYEATLMYLEYRLERIRKERLGVAYKNSYLRGFIWGIDERFEKQKEELQKFELMLQVPVEVEQAFEERISGTFTYSVPTVELDEEAYRAGYEHAKNSSIMPEELLNTERK
ncbi:DUF7168 domain-containing protein [Ligilactobacillus murinus]|uniref:DUF2786 domain-containing protein n=1 Tax=Ligilactobacillus murinus TaxID=1622 RepID=A0AAE6WJU9_9LACO|nr:DUF2786 domain-containing protein [Ligilactobacillus murinus]NEF83233.1 DUF2786 domain-containing protein [Ligilactobacillus murinus]NEF85385.1 DUF2786 domain-containing protein [Ligilactobacillus murinus]NEF87784.1 DUF2786 domain-containing protein [Ligilactobacillus murinus]NEF90082.1 DUF2786 domain-containing protein [Ligilactobacillus murinus]NEF92353.1 DUF2786 domain-containing protein [Ligilactobacillus murinus]